MISRFFFFNSSFNSFYIISVSGDCLDFTFKTLSNCYRHYYDLSISRFKKVFVISRIFFKQLSAFYIILTWFPFPVIACTSHMKNLSNFCRQKYDPSISRLFFLQIFVQLCSFSRLKNTFKNLSNWCRHKYDPSISRFFWLDFWHSAQLFGAAAAVARAASTHKLSLLVG